MPTYNTRTFKENMKLAFQQAKAHETVLITRHDETFRLVLEKTPVVPIPTIGSQETIPSQQVNNHKPM